MNFHTRPEWQNIEVQSINRLAAHSPYGNSYSLSLDGAWRFKLCEHPSLLPAGFYLPDFNDDAWRQINVPGNWELQGEGEPIYTNYAYPFTDEPGAHRITPGFIAEGDYGAGCNPPGLPDKIPTGLYRRRFDLPEHFVGKKLILNLGGVEGGFYVWVNGNPVGYSQDSKLMAEFDITRMTYLGSNQITVQVMRFTDATWLEDQDYWHLSGIFRPVTLFAKPRMHIEDVKISADMQGNATFDVSVTRVSGYADTLVRLHIYDPDGNIIYKEKRAPSAVCPPLWDNSAPQPGHAVFNVHIDDPLLWSPEAPNLYRVHLALMDPSGADAADRERAHFGFRSVYIEDGILKLNGKRLIIRGVNRHEHNVTTGRYITREQMKKEVSLLKQLNVNAVRSCHYPNDPYFYDLCDEFGLMAICETNLETHGVGAMLTNSPEWSEAFLQRARRMAQIHKNHPSIIIWSLGNESGLGPNHAAMAGWLKYYDPTRPVQYESGAPGKNISDIRCPMYPAVEQIEKLLADAGDERPVILCEYAYQILSSGGGFEYFRKLTETYPRFQGGFVWDFQDKALWQTDENGNRFPGYGGDFFESVTDPFCPRFMCLNGIVNHDLTVKPAGAEMAFVYRPVFIEQTDKGFVIKNRNLFTPTHALRLTWTAYADGEAQSTGEMLLPALEPMAEHRFEAGPARLPGQVCWIDMDLDTDTDAPLYFQFPIQALPLLLRKARYSPARFDEARGEISVTGDGFTLQILKSSGNIVSISVNGKEYMLNGLSECMIRGLSGLNAGPDWGEWDNFAAFAPENCVRRIVSLSASALSDGRVMIERCSRITSTLVDEACADVNTRLLISGDGRIGLEASFRLNGIPCVERLGLSFTLPEDFQKLEWLGMGPGESYPDRTLAARMGTYACDVAETHFPYNPPAENGGHEKTLRVTLAAEDGRAIRFASSTPFHFDAHNYTPCDLRDAMHEHEIPVRHETTLHIDAAHTGIGGQMAWSTRQDEKYAVGPGTYNLELEIELR